MLLSSPLSRSSVQHPDGCKGERTNQVRFMAYKFPWNKVIETIPAFLVYYYFLCLVEQGIKLLKMVLGNKDVFRRKMTNVEKPCYRNTRKLCGLWMWFPVQERWLNILSMKLSRQSHQKTHSTMSRLNKALLASHWVSPIYSGTTTSTSTDIPTMKQLHSIVYLVVTNTGGTVTHRSLWSLREADRSEILHHWRCVLSEGGIE